MSDAERKVAEADVYLKRLNEREQEINHVKFRDSVYTREMEKQLELSQMSAWTGDEIGAASKKPDRPRTSRGRDPKQPDSEKLVETIVTLRQEKNVHEEQIKLLKTAIMRLKKQLAV